MAASIARVVDRACRDPAGSRRARPTQSIARERATVTGDGPPLILLAGGIDYRGRGWDSTVAYLAAQRRVVRFVRRFYRPELGNPFGWTMADEARDVAALATALGGEVELLGHSSGGVLALECLPAEPGLYRAAVVSRRRSTTLRPPGATHWCGRGAN